MVFPSSLPPPRPLPLNIFLLTAPSAKALDASATAAATWLEGGDGSSQSLMDVAYTSSILLDKLHPHRLAVLGSSCSEMATKLRTGKYQKGFLPPGDFPPKLCFLHPGLGSNYPNMGAELYNNLPEYREHIDEFNAPKKTEFLEGNNSETSGALFTDIIRTSSCLNYLLNSWGISPDFSLGHSIGEYPAALSAGIYRMPQMKRATDVMRSQGLDNAYAKAKMVIILADEATFKPLMDRVDLGKDGWLEVAVRNTETQFVVGGGEREVMEFMALCTENEIPVFLLPLHHAFHTSPYRNGEAKWNELSRTCTRFKPTAKYISAMTGDILEPLYPEYWAEHAYKAVNFHAASLKVLECGARVFLELGGKALLGALLIENSNGMEGLTVLGSLKTGKSEMETIFTSLAKLFTLGYDVNWHGFYKDFQVRRISLPDFIAKSDISQPVSPKLTNWKLVSKYDHDSFWSAMDSVDNCSEKRAIIQHLLLTMLRNATDDPTLELEPTTELRDIGIDSVQAIGMKGVFDRILGSRASIRIQMLISSRTLDQLTQNLFKLLYPTPTKCPAEQGDTEEIERVRKLMAKDSKLCRHIKTTGLPKVVPLPEVRTILLTGATGQLAPYVLEELTKRPQIQKVYCLVRNSNNGVTPQERLIRHLKEINLLERVDMRKVEAVVGDLVLENLGLEPTLHTRLASEVDAVFNSAVNASHLAPYVEEDVKYGGVRAVNVIGTLRVLEFASTTRVKWIWAASTFLTLVPMSNMHYYRNPEDWPTPSIWEEGSDALDLMWPLGYPLSKFMGDHLFHEGSYKGIPCKVFRFAKIGGDGLTGRQKVKENHFFLKFLYYIASGLMPDKPVPLMQLSVDNCAIWSVRTFFDERGLPSDIYNVTAPYAQEEDLIVGLGEEFGAQLRLLLMVAKMGEENVKEKLAGIVKAGGPLGTLFKELEITLGPNWMERPETIFANEKLNEMISSMFGFPVTPVPYEKFLARLLQDGEDSLVYTWSEIYENSNLRKVLRLGAEDLPMFESWYDNRETYFSWGKIEMLYPNLGEEIESPLESVRRDISYVVRNAKELFSPKSGKTNGQSSA